MQSIWDWNLLLSDKYYANRILLMVELGIQFSHKFKENTWKYSSLCSADRKNAHLFAIISKIEHWTGTLISIIHRFTWFKIFFFKKSSARTHTHPMHFTKMNVNVGKSEIDVFSSCLKRKPFEKRKEWESGMGLIAMRFPFIAILLIPFVSIISNGCHKYNMHCVSMIY